MYGEPDDDYGLHDGEEESEEIPTEMWQESSWITISAFFEEKGRNDTFPFVSKYMHLISFMSNSDIAQLVDKS